MKGAVAVLLMIAVLVLVVFVSAKPEAAAAAANNSLTIDLFHYNSPLSPFYDPSISETELAMRDVMNSIVRAERRMFLRRRATTTEEQEINSTIFLGQASYLMKIFIGTPPQESIVNADTGSSLLWVQCQPCEKCFDHDAPIFNPVNSQTYTTLSCDSEICSSLKSFTNCGSDNHCRYEHRYGDDSKTSGDLASEHVGFTADGTKSIIMGCGTRNTGTFKTDEAGIGGLGPSNFSLISQLGGGDQNALVFSYCLTPPSAKNPGKFRLHPTRTIVDLPGVLSTSLTRDPDYYITLLSGISVDKNPGMVQPTNLEVIVDSGTTVTWLNNAFYNDVVAMIIKSIDKTPVDRPPYPYTLCYLQTELTKVPDINFHFAGDTVTFTGTQMFWPVQDRQNFWAVDTWCLMIFPHDDDRSILGNRAQVNFNVEYNVNLGILSFQPTDCERF